MTNKYANLVGTDKIKDSFNQITTGFDGVDADITTHLAETVADGVHGMGTAAAEDYEKGTFTPELLLGGFNVGMTYSSQVGKYIKIGNLIIFELDIFLSAKGTSTGNINIAGLPYVSSSDSPFRTYTPGYLRKVSQPANTIQIGLRHFVNFSSLDMIANISGADFTALNDTNIAADSRIVVSGSYRI